jgi:hypothetical protein
MEANRLMCEPARNNARHRAGFLMSGRMTWAKCALDVHQHFLKAMQGAGLSSRIAYRVCAFGVCQGRFDTLSISAASARVEVCKFAEGSTSERALPSQKR